MSDIMEEIGEDLRRQELVKFWKDNGGWIIGCALMAVFMTGAIVFWRGHSDTQNTQATAALLKTLQTADAARLEQLAAAQSGEHAALAKLSAAALHADRNEKEAALKLWNEVAGMGGVDAAYRDLAKILSIGQRIGVDAPEKLHEELKPLTGKNDKWRFSAMELQALLYAREGKSREAAAVLTAITGDANAPDDVRARAYTLRDLYSGEQP